MAPLFSPSRFVLSASIFEFSSNYPSLINAIPFLRSFIRLSNVSRAFLLFQPFPTLISDLRLWRDTIKYNFTNLVIGPIFDTGPILFVRDPWLYDLTSNTDAQILTFS